MSNPCLASTCLNGNCVGCRSGSTWCDDPRCFPNCPNCPKTNTNNTWMIVIILVLLGILLVMSFIIGYSWYKDRQRASEPKRVTINKHNHTIVPAPIIVGSPPSSIVPDVLTTAAIPIIPVNNCGNNVAPSETLSYNNMQFSLN